MKPALLGSTCGDKQGDKLGDRADSIRSDGNKPLPLRKHVPCKNAWTLISVLGFEIKHLLTRNSGHRTL